MKPCPVCHEPIDERAVECPHCQVVVEKAEIRLAWEREQEELQQRQSALARRAPLEIEASGRWPWPVIVVSLVAVVALGAYLLVPRSFPVVDLPLADEDAVDVDPCAETERCLVVYLTPWCPACRKSTRVIQSVRKMLERAPDVGMKIVVGLDERPKLRAMAVGFGSGVYLDGDGEFWKATGASGVPHWFVARGETLEASLAGAYPNARDQLDDLGLLDDLEPSE